MEGIRVGAMVAARRMEIKGQDQIGKWSLFLISWDRKWKEWGQDGDKMALKEKRT